MKLIVLGLVVLLFCFLTISAFDDQSELKR
jgi:hypothetical protein